jgi:hypothetical protein
VVLVLVADVVVDVALVVVLDTVVVVLESVVVERDVLVVLVVTEVVEEVHAPHMAGHACETHDSAHRLSVRRRAQLASS